VVTPLQRATDAPEHMDAPDADRAALAAALDHIVAVNRWLGARRALRRHLPWALPPDGGGPHRVLDVGTGAGDLALAMVAWARARKRPVHVAALDLHSATLRVARDRSAGTDEIAVVRADGLRLPFPDGAFDLVCISMTLHHMDGPDLAGLLREAARAARGGRVLVGELERSLPGYLGARLLAATVWRRNPITRHDGPLSVLRAFTPDELLALGRQAGLARPSVHRHPLFRLVLRGEARDG
jgi:SAM-dependent methyltransferase